MLQNSDGPEFQKLVQRLGKAMHTQDGSISSDHLDSIVRGILLHALQSAMGALSEPVEDPAQEIAVHGKSAFCCCQPVHAAAIAEALQGRLWH